VLFKIFFENHQEQALFDAKALLTETEYFFNLIKHKKEKNNIFNSL
jgi:hypothetical protein